MDNIALRIKELIDHKGLTNGEFAKAIDINPSIISHVLSGRNKPSLQLIESIKANFTNVNLDYLLTGNGDLFSQITNVKEDVPEQDFPDLTNVSGFPMDGVRHAAIPGSMPTQAQEEEESEPEEKPVVKDPPPTPAPSSATDDDIEQIVVFYKNGTFKVYRSAKP